MRNPSCDVLILGGGMVGLSIAYQLIARGITHSISIVDKEPDLGLHSSGRNSGVLHAGLYYKPGSLKAKVCVDGARRLRSWVEHHHLPLNLCGKVIVPPRLELDPQLDLMAERGKANGAVVEFLDSKDLHDLVPQARTASGRALWSPNTAVVKPLSIIRRLRLDLIESGVRFIYGLQNCDYQPLKRLIQLPDGTQLSYGHLFNTAGLQADRVAKTFGVGSNYSLLPFKGLYWQLKPSFPFKLRTNLYPVPDLSVPFLGVHFTPSADPSPIVTIGPTATPAFGRENYRGLEAIEPEMAIKNIGLLLRQYLRNRGGFRRYVHDQAFLAFPPLFIKAAQELIPVLKPEHIELSTKVGIRSQLYNYTTERLEDDFLCLPGISSTHVLNAISPAFTASFALADLIIDQALPTFNLL